MSKDILGLLVRALVTVPEDRLGLVKDLVFKLSRSDGAQWERELKHLLRKEPCWVTPNPELKLLKFVSSQDIPARFANFVVKENFVCDIRPRAHIKISALGANFRKRFLDGAGKIELPIERHKLHCYDLSQCSIDSQIVGELGGDEKVETALLEILYLIAGTDGGILDKQKVHVFYVRDTAGELCAVRVVWIGLGWSINSSSVVRHGTWKEGSQVYTRNLIEQGQPESALDTCAEGSVTRTA